MGDETIGGMSSAEFIERYGHTTFVLLQSRQFIDRYFDELDSAPGMAELIKSGTHTGGIVDVSAHDRDAMAHFHDLLELFKHAVIDSDVQRAAFDRLRPSRDHRLWVQLAKMFPVGTNVRIWCLRRVIDNADGSLYGLLEAYEMLRGSGERECFGVILREKILSLNVSLERCLVAIQRSKLVTRSLVMELMQSLAAAERE